MLPFSETLYLRAFLGKGRTKKNKGSSPLITSPQKLVLTIKEPNGHLQYLEIDYQP